MEFEIEETEQYDIIENNKFNAATDVKFQLRSPFSSTEIICASKKMLVSDLLLFLRDKFEIKKGDTFRIFEIGVGEVTSSQISLSERFGNRFSLAVDIEKKIENLKSEDELRDYIIKNFLGKEYIARKGMEIPSVILYTIRELSALLSFDEISSLFDVKVNSSDVLSSTDVRDCVKLLLSKTEDVEMKKRLNLFLDNKGIVTKKQIDDLYTDLGTEKKSQEIQQSIEEEYLISILGGKEEYERQKREFEKFRR